MTDNEDGTYSYSDGMTPILHFTAEELEAWFDDNELPESIDFEVLAFGFGPHTDASVIPPRGTATDKGGTLV